MLGPVGGGQLYSRAGPTFTFGLGAGVVLAALGLLAGTGPLAALQPVPEHGS